MLFFWWGCILSSGLAQVWTWNTIAPVQMGNSAQGVTALAKGNGSDIWIGTDAGLVLFSDGQLSALPIFNSTFIRTLLWDSISSSLLVGTDGAGLYIQSGNTWTQLFPQAQNGLPETRIQSVSIHQGNVWVGGAEKGLFKYENGGWQQFNALTTSGQLPFSSVTSLLSAQNGLWVGTQAHGLYFLFNQGGFTNLTVDSGLPVAHVQSIFHQDPYVWLGFSGTQGDHHLARYHTQQKAMQVFGPSTGYPVFRQVYAFQRDSLNHIWIGSHGGDLPLAYFDGQTFTGIPEFSSGFLSSPVKALLHQGGQKIWVGHFGGLSVNSLLPTSIQPSSADSDLMPFPNPFSKKLNIPEASSSTSWELIPLSGGYIQRGLGSTISGNSLAPGVYILRWKGKEGKVQQSFVLRKND